MKKLTLAAIAIVLTFSGFAQSYDLKLNLEKGKVYKQGVITDMKMSLDMMGNLVDINMTMSTFNSYKVLDIKDGNFNLEVKYDSMRMNMKFMGQERNYNSESNANPANDMLSNMIQSFKNKSFKIKMTPAGDIVDVSDTDSMFADFFKANANLTEEQRASAKKQLESSFGPENIKNALASSCGIFPATAVKVGDKWTKNGNFTANMNATISTTYELKEINKDYFVLGSVSEFVKDDKSTMDLNGIKVNLDLSGNITGDFKVNRKTGWVLSSEGKQNVNAEGEIAMNNGGAEGEKVKIKMKIEGNSIIK